MAYIELYDDKVFNLINLGKTIRQFNEYSGDYIIVEVYQGNSQNPIGKLQSNKLLFRDKDTGGYYIGDYHYHPENPEMGFCPGAIHSDSNMGQLIPMTYNENVSSFNVSDNLRKQVDIYKDDSGNIFIKPNEILKLLNLKGDRYRLRIFFQRKIKSNLGSFLKIMKNNLIENGCFFSGLEATQAGDIDMSSGKNNFVRIENPGFSPYVLNQSGIINNKYTMQVTGIKPNSTYVFSCWVAWDSKYNGGGQIVSFSDVSSMGATEGFTPHSTTNLGGSYIDDEEDLKTGRILKKKNSGNLIWYKAYSFVQTNGNADLGSIDIHLGLNGDDNFPPSTDPLSNRFFTDLRFEQVESLEGEIIVEYLNKLRTEDYVSEYQYSVASYDNFLKANSNKPNLPIDSGTSMDSDSVINPEEQAVISEFSNFDIEGAVNNVLGSPTQETTQQETDNQMMRKGGRVRTKPVRRK